jgi:polar amino acid transport system substrate-binding protein
MTSGHKWMCVRFVCASIILVGAVTCGYSQGLPAGRSSTECSPAKVVRVGGYVFPPYVQEDSGKFKGLTLDLIEVMNAFQSKYRFEFVPTSPLRRYSDFENGAYDVILFESVEWGWRRLPVDVSKVYAQDCEVFVAKTLPNRTQAYFDDIKGKSLLVYLGYHYPFADYNSDPEYLLRAFNARATVSHEANLRSVIAGRADLAVVTRSYLEKYLSDNPALMPRLMISDRKEQHYDHTVLVKRNDDPSVGEINDLLERMERAGYISILLGKYGIDASLCSGGRGQSEQTSSKALPSQLSGSTIVKVGGYHFPPYVELESGQPATGLTLDLLALMNAFQSDHHFVFVPTTPLTRYQDFADGAFDALFFERKEWGWQDYPVDSSREFLKDCEVYVARAGQNRTQSYFDSLEGKSILGYLGYHYPIADFKTDPTYLLSKHNMRVTASHGENVQSILHGRADVAIVTRSYVIRYLRSHPALIPRLLVSKKTEQEYRHTFLVRADSGKLMKQIAEILSALEKVGYASVLWGKYDVTPISESP